MSDESSIQAAAEVLRRGGLVAFPTETVYGLGADATNAQAVRRIFEVKGRPSTNPLICHIADESVARRYAKDWSRHVGTSRLAQRFWPGPLTLVVPKTQAIVDEATTPAKSPGQSAKHYAPRTPAFRFHPRDRGKLDMTEAAIVELTLDPETYARNLYARLRLLDAQQLRAIYIEMPPDLPEWAAVRDRLLRATQPLP